MNERIILDLCGGTGSWSKPYRDAGYTVRNITLPEYDVRTFEPPENIYGILAAPPCTMFSIARTTAKTSRDFHAAIQVVQACLEIIWTCRIYGSLKWWALENPVGYLRQFLGRPLLTMRPCMYGDPIGKPTDVWGYFKQPRKLRTPITFKKGRNGASAWYDSVRDPAKRAITPPMWAYAFFKANP